MGNKKMKSFTSGKQMYDYITAGNDLYSKKLGLYVFHYNNAGAICCYSLNSEEVVEILKKREETDEYWGAYLGIGGSILEDSDYDDDEHRYSEDETMRNLYLQPSYDFCEEYYSCDDWMNTNDVTVNYLTKSVLLEQLSEERLAQLTADGNSPEDILELIEEWGIQQVNDGYGVFEYDGTGLLEVERIDDVGAFKSDRQAVKAAIKNGVKIIPVTELPEYLRPKYGIECMWYLGWLDTPENRENLKKYAKEHALIPNRKLTGKEATLVKYENLEIILSQRYGTYFVYSKELDAYWESEEDSMDEVLKVVSSGTHLKGEWIFSSVKL